MLEFTRRQALAFGATGHGLAARRPHAELIEAVRAAGLRRTRHAARSLAARVDGVAEADVARALDAGRLVAFYGFRGVVMVAAPESEDVPIFSAGAAPVGEATLRTAWPGAFVRRLDLAKVTATDALATVVEAVHTVLAGGPLPRREAVMAVTRLATPPCRGRCPDPHVEDSLVRLSGPRFLQGGDVLVAPEPGDGPWRSELVRRYLSCYGPSTARTLAPVGRYFASRRSGLPRRAGRRADCRHGRRAPRCRESGSSRRATYAGPLP